MTDMYGERGVSMKRQIRHGVFETNSSSVHSLTMCTQEEYDKWEKGEMWFDGYNDKFIDPFDPMVKYAEDLAKYKDNRYSKEELAEDYMREDGIYRNTEEYDDRNGEYNDVFVEYYTTPGGEKIVAFGYSGYDA